MALKKFSDHCEGCRPAVMDVTNDTIFPPDHPAMIAINKYWNNETTYNQRLAWHAVTCLNSQKSSDLRVAEKLARRFSMILREHLGG